MGSLGIETTDLVLVQEEQEVESGNLEACNDAMYFIYGDNSEDYIFFSTRFKLCWFVDDVSFLDLLVVLFFLFGVSVLLLRRRDLKFYIGYEIYKKEQRNIKNVRPRRNFDQRPVHS